MLIHEGQCAKQLSHATCRYPPRPAPPGSCWRVRALRRGERLPRLPHRRDKALPTDPAEVWLQSYGPCEPSPESPFSCMRVNDTSLSLGETLASIGGGYPR